MGCFIAPIKNLIFTEWQWKTRRKVQMMTSGSDWLTLPVPSYSWCAQVYPFDKSFLILISFSSCFAHPCKLTVFKFPKLVVRVMCGETPKVAKYIDQRWWQWTIGYWQFSPLHQSLIAPLCFVPLTTDWLEQDVLLFLLADTKHTAIHHHRLCALINQSQQWQVNRLGVIAAIFGKWYMLLNNTINKMNHSNRRHLLYANVEQRKEEVIFGEMLIQIMQSTERGTSHYKCTSDVRGDIFVCSESPKWMCTKIGQLDNICNLGVQGQFNANLSKYKQY